MIPIAKPAWEDDDRVRLSSKGGGIVVVSLGDVTRASKLASKSALENERQVLLQEDRKSKAALSKAAISAWPDGVCRKATRTKPFLYVQRRQQQEQMQKEVDAEWLRHETDAHAAAVAAAQHAKLGTAPEVRDAVSRALAERVLRERALQISQKRVEKDTAGVESYATSLLIPEHGPVPGLGAFGVKLNPTQSARSQQHELRARFESRHAKVEAQLRCDALAAHSDAEATRLQREADARGVAAQRTSLIAGLTEQVKTKRQAKQQEQLDEKRLAANLKEVDSTRVELWRRVRGIEEGARQKAAAVSNRLAMQGVERQRAQEAREDKLVAAAIERRRVDDELQQQQKAAAREQLRQGIASGLKTILAEKEIVRQVQAAEDRGEVERLRLLTRQEAAAKAQRRLQARKDREGIAEFNKSMAEARSSKRAAERVAEKREASEVQASVLDRFSALEISQRISKIERDGSS